MKQVCRPYNNLLEAKTYLLCKQNGWCDALCFKILCDEIFSKADVADEE